jgi:hypothetical protein
MAKRGRREEGVQLLFIVSHNLLCDMQDPTSNDLPAGWPPLPSRVHSPVDRAADSPETLSGSSSRMGLYGPMT